MVISNIVFFLLMAGFAYLVNFKLKFPVSDPMPKLICNIFVAIVFVMWALQLFGVGI